MSAPIMSVSGLTVRFPVAGGLRKREIVGLAPTDLDVERREVLAIVGESGSGKTTLGRAMLRLIPNSGGSIEFDGTDIATQSQSMLGRMRARMQMIFQDPYTSLNPRKTVGRTLGEVLAHVGVPKAERRNRAERLLEQVGLDASAHDRWPSAFSGGQRQRVAIARALATDPDLIVADEPVSALDVSVQAQVVNLLIELKEQRGLTLVIVSHDLGFVAAIADRVAVMYFGRIVEVGFAAEVIAKPRHPYTAMLNANILHPDVDAARAMLDASAATASADLPSLLDPPSGCAFAARCRHASDICRRTEPPLLEIAPGRMAACHHPLDPNSVTERTAS